jgi:two-component system sensor histidine kinase BarA
MTFSRFHRAGIAVLDSRGQVLVDIPAEHAICRRISAHPRGGALGCAFDSLVSAEHQIDDVPQQANCLCGLRYELLAIRHQGETLGRLVFGPYRPENLTTLPRGLARALGEAGDVSDNAFLGSVQTDLERLEVVPTDQAQQIITAIGGVLSVIVHTGYARHLTSQIHIAAIQDAYNELSEKNRRLADSVEKLKDLDKLKSSFLATISHELRTPLTSVIGYSEMLLEGLAGDLSKEQNDYVRTILEKGDHLLRIINEILDVSRIESGAVQLNFETFDIPDLLRQVADAMMPQAQQKEISLTYDAASNVPVIVADRAKTRQVLINLVSNAIKFTPTGGTVSMLVTRKEVVDGGGVSRPSVEMRVVDTGIGVPQDSRDKIFEAFFQVDGSSTRVHGGTGLGLSIVKHFVEAHGGHVWVEDGEEQQGSVFVVQLPINPPADVRAKRSRSSALGGTLVG